MGEEKINLPNFVLHFYILISVESHANNFKGICSHMFSLKVTLMPEVRAYFLFLSTGSVSSRQQCSHKGLLHFWFSSFWTRKCNNSNNITMLENQQRCIVSMSTEHTKLRLELAISGFLKWVNHWKDILRLESAAPSHECHHEYLPHIESLLRSQTSSGWYISGRQTLVVSPAAVYL